MADEPDADAAVDALLTGWGTPAPRSDFVERVLARVDAVAPVARPRTRWRWALPFALGSALGAVVAVFVMQRRDPTPDASTVVSPIHLDAPGVGEVVAEPGSELSWTRGADGALVLEVRTGVAWVRVDADGPPLGVLADGEEVRLGRPCSRVAVARGFFSVDVTVDDVDCALVDAEVERARAELYPAGSR